MKIGVVSDTHMPRFAKALPFALRDGLLRERVALILHLGDFTAPEVAGLFGELAPFDAVAGNNDGPELQRRFGRRKLLELDRVRVGMTHGDALRRASPDCVLEAFADDAPDVILFGHSHTPYCARHGDVWLLNPGSPTDKRRNPRYSWGLLEIAGGGVRAQLQFYDDKRPAP